MSYEVEHLVEVKSLLGEGPLWNSAEQALYWVDIEGNCFFRYYPASGKHERFEAGTKIGCLGLRQNGGLAMLTKQGLVFWDWTSQKLEFVSNPNADKPYMRFNDGKVDPQGRFWGGAMYDGNPEVDVREGSLYRFESDGSYQEMQTKIAIPNGLGWSLDQKTMYHTDSPRHTIYAYDYNAESGDITNRRDFIHNPEMPGVPDGLAIDSEGYIWGARWGGWRVTRYTPTGEIDREIEFPVQQVTCCTFGGANLDELYITSARENYTPELAQQQPLGGDLFRVKVGIRGLETNKFAG